MTNKKRVEMKGLPHRPEELTPEQAERIRGGGSNNLNPNGLAADGSVRHSQPMESLSLN